MKEKVAILQPLIPHYRSEFFEKLNELFPLNVYVYETKTRAKQSKLNLSNLQVNPISNLLFKDILFYNPIPFLSKRFDTLVLMIHFAHITTWLLLLTKALHKKRIILWGHGISVKRYISEESQPSFLLKWMIGLADGIWVYTEKEAKIWRKVYPELDVVALDNTISNLDEILDTIEYDKQNLKVKHDIRQSQIFIFCARFNNNHRRIDLLIEIVKTVDSERFGFIIIGEGDEKPDFSAFNNVYDFGAVYDRQLKDELFQIADIYLQPGWVGLSIVEAMAYGKPIFTFKRSLSVLQCVEYSYLTDKYNSRLFDDLSSGIGAIESTSKDEVARMGNNSREFVKLNLSMENMVNRAYTSLRREFIL